MIDRKQLGQTIAQTFRAVRRVSAIRYRVKSQSGNGKYVVRQTSLGWNCSCRDHKFRGVRCKHIYAVEFSFAIRETVRLEVVIQPISQLVSTTVISEYMVKNVRRNNQYGIQRYLCKDCHKRFSFNIGFEKMRCSAEGNNIGNAIVFQRRVIS